MAVENVCFNSGQAYTVSEWSGLDQVSCETAGGVWQLLPLSLETLFQTYFAFDPSLMESIIGYTVLAFALGLGTGYVVTLMRRL
jgi:hypothetical protein